MDERMKFDTALTLKGLSAIVAALSTAITEGDARPTNEMIAHALYTIEVGLDQAAYEVEQSEKREIDRLVSVSKETGIPMKQLYEL